MHIAVEGTCWHHQRGYGRYVRGLVEALVALDDRNRYTLVTDDPSGPTPFPARCAVKAVRAGVPTLRAASATRHRSLRDLARMARALGSPEFDLVFFPTVYSYVPIVSRARKVVMMMDVIADTYPELTLPSRVSRWCWQVKTALARRQADCIVTVSDYSRDLLLRRTGRRPEQVVNIGTGHSIGLHSPVGAAWSARLGELGLRPSDRLIVYVGGISPHKNLPTLVRAFGSISTRRAFQDVLLVIVGAQRHDGFLGCLPDLQREHVSQGLRHRILTTGFLPDAALTPLLAQATALVLPSLMEGIGLPAVEAAACGCPVIATSRSPLPALLGPGALYVDPDDLDGWKTALVTVLTSPALRAAVRRAGQAAVRQLSWSSVVDRLVEVFARTHER
jgi:glycosyltransferase involved in cell wall biosynthesis